MKEYFVYIMANRSRILYTGVTSDLKRRVIEHKQHLIKGFTSRYNMDKLVYFETGSDINEAIYREKEIKGWIRVKKIKLIETINSNWDDLSINW